MAERIRVEVCYALPQRVFLRTVEVDAGATIEQAVRRSGLLEEFPDFDLASHAAGIYAKKKPLDTVLKEHDRIELYRPLLADPKETRRRRAAGKSKTAR